ncbi:dihydrofolate reductase [Granulicella aggregans]|uniref:Dihydrofolate reductase n=1 Tax=Granulicella aggregans TaxID=474949 RepID=A0A7W8E7M0_9BACT|nr:dihydrofolate reductase [Granulicella aggregans]MBB5060410.1 dihydrofolate reductase [Granulicella aggregans]
MKVTLWATLSANGNYSRSTPENPPRPQAFQDFERHARVAGNFIVGRSTFEGFAARGPNPAFASLDIVVVSTNSPAIEGVHVVSSPSEALELLEQRGYTSALLSGGEKLHNAFLAQGLVDELVLNHTPVIEGAGLNIHLPAGKHQVGELLEMIDLGGGVVQTRYSIKR